MCNLRSILPARHPAIRRRWGNIGSRWRRISRLDQRLTVPSTVSPVPEVKPPPYAQSETFRKRPDSTFSHCGMPKKAPGHRHFFSSGSPTSEAVTRYPNERTCYGALSAPAAATCPNRHACSLDHPESPHMAPGVSGCNFGHTRYWRLSGLPQKRSSLSQFW